MQKNFVVYDIETTGLDLVKDQIIELGATKYSPQGELIDKFQSFVSLDRVETIPELVVELTSIIDEDLEGAPSEEEALIAFDEWSGESIFIAHNGNRFDHQFLNNSITLHGIEGQCPNFYRDGGKMQKKVLIDSISLAKKYSKEKGDCFSNFKLAYLIDKLELEYDPNAHHRADWDAEMTAKVVLKLLEAESVKEELKKTLKTLEKLG